MVSSLSSRCLHGRKAGKVSTHDAMLRSFKWHSACAFRVLPQPSIWPSIVSGINLHFMFLCCIFRDEFVCSLNKIMKRIEYGGYHHSSVLCTYMWRMLETTLNKSYPIDTRGSFPGVKRPGREADHSPPSSAKVNECVELYLHSPLRLHGVVLSQTQAQIYLYLTFKKKTWGASEGHLIVRNLEDNIYRSVSKTFRTESITK
jgi:hypothetical protein